MTVEPSSAEDDLKNRVEVPELVFKLPMWPKAAFVSDVSIPDKEQVALGSIFTKTWLVRNTGSEDWPVDTTLSHVDGDQLIVLCDDIPVQCAPGRCVEITVKLQVPLTAATTGRSIRSYFSLHGGDFWSFGDQLHVEVVVVTNK